MIYQYRVNIKQITRYEEISEFLKIISKTRKTKSEKYIFDKDKIRCVLGEVMLRYILEKHFKCENQKIEIAHTEYGKPILKNKKNLFFSFSHSGEWAICAVGNKNLGIDVERIEEINIMDIYSIFSLSEQKWLDMFESSRKIQMFYKLWTLKESFVKYNGMGLGYSFDSFSFKLTNSEILLFENNIPNRSVSFLSNKIDDKHWYALCYNPNEVLNNQNELQYSELKDWFLIHSLC